MITFSVALMIVHIIGLALATGSATIKLTLLLRCKTDPSFYPVYFRIDTTLTRFIITGMILLTVSGISWLIIGYSFEPFLIVKIMLVGIIWILGPIIDNKTTPKLKKLAPVNGATPSPEFLLIQKQHLSLEIAATILMYAITIIGILL